MGVVRVVIQRILPLRGVHPPVVRPRQPQEEHEGVAVGDGGDGSGRAWVFFDFGWSLLETREAKLKWGGEIGTS